MIFEIDNPLLSITADRIRPDHLTMGLITLKELEQQNDHLGFSEATISECYETDDRFRSKIDVYQDYSFGIITVVDAADDLSIQDKVGFYLKKNLLLLIEIVDADKSVSRLFEDAVSRLNPESATLGRIMYAILQRLIDTDNKALEALEDHIDELECKLLDGRADAHFEREILVAKKRLLALHNYYEQLIDIGEELQENENDCFSEDDLRYFKIFTDKSSRLNNNVLMFRENLSQLRDSYLASLDYNTNRTMKLFTVVTTIFLPLTLIVGWYGMNFTTMPELTWQYGYLAVILLCVAVVIGCFWLFKKKKLL
ncbi:MAG: CorA family divalent cation transporter [Clostridia bacterium]